MNSVNEKQYRTTSAVSALTEKNRIKKPISADFSGSTFCAVLVLIALNVVLYFQSMHGYFLADDFIHVPWLVNVFHGHPELLLKNFTSNWMQTDGTLFYRPLISLTMAGDYAIYGTHSSGYHVTNLIFQIASTLFLFLACRRMFGWSVALGAACLFAVSPLHCEVVSWVIARVDSVATTFYLASFWLFLRCWQSDCLAQPADKHIHSHSPDAHDLAASDLKQSAKSTNEQEESTSMLRTRPGLIIACSAVMFTLSLLSKEIAVTLPAALTLYCLIYPRTSGAVKERFLDAGKSTAVFWLLLFAYLVVRTLALGTLSGGYGGSIGAGLSSSVYQRWIGDGSFGRILFPLNEQVFLHGDKTRHYLKLLYQIGGALLAVRLLLPLFEKFASRFKSNTASSHQQSEMQRTGDLSVTYMSSDCVPSSEASRSACSHGTEKPAAVGIGRQNTNNIDSINNWSWLKHVAFAAGWFVVVMLPAYQVFNLSTTLQGGRFIYLGTAPLSLLLAVLLLPARTPEWTMFGSNSNSIVARVRRSSLTKSASSSSIWLRLTSFLHTVSGAVLVCLIVCFAIIAYRNNDPWVRASEGVRALQQAIEQQFRIMPAGKSIALINLPQRYRGAHMIYNGAMFNILVQPPLSDRDYSQRIATFEAIMFGQSDLINISRLRRMAADLKHYSVFAWNESTNKLLPLTAGQLKATEDFIGVEGNLRAMRQENSNVLLTRTASSPNSKTPACSLVMSWTSSSGTTETQSSPLKLTDALQTVRFAVSDRKSWIMSQVDRKLQFQVTTPDYVFDIVRVYPVSGEHLVPRLEFQPQYLNSCGKRTVEDSRGVTWTGAQIGPFLFDVSSIPEAHRAIYEISKRDSWFDHYSESMKDRALAPEVTERGYLDGVCGERVELRPRSVIQQAGYYDFRIFAVDKAERIVGYSSDPICVWLTPAPSGPSGSDAVQPAGARR